MDQDECQSQHREVGWAMPVPQDIYETVLRSLKGREEFRLTGKCIECGQRVALSFTPGKPIVIPE